MIRRIDTYEINCDYPGHGGSKDVGRGYEFHLLGDIGEEQKVVCENCWGNRLEVETLLKLIGVKKRKYMHDDKLSYHHLA